MNKSIFVSATPGKFELELSAPSHLQAESPVRGQPPPGKEVPDANQPVSSTGRSSSRPRLGALGGDRVRKSGRLGWDEIGDIVDAQAVIRPTGITDPPVDIRPSEGQVADLVQECKARVERDERVLVTALTKRMAGEVVSRIIRLWSVGWRADEWHLMRGLPCLSLNIVLLLVSINSSEVADYCEGVLGSRGTWLMLLLELLLAELRWTHLGMILLRHLVRSYSPALFCNSCSPVDTHGLCSPVNIITHLGHITI